MFDYYFTFRSVTWAQRAEKALVRNGLRVSILRAPKFLSQKGCGYALRVRGGQGTQAAAILRRDRALWDGVYRVYQDGTVEPATL